MAVYFEPQREDRSFASGFSKGLTQMAQMYLQQQLQQGNMDKRAGLVNERDKNLFDLNTERNQTNMDMKQGLINQTYGANAQVPIAQGQNPIFIEGLMNPTNSGLTPQQLNQMKAQAMTGVKAPDYMPKPVTPNKPLGYQTTVQNGETFTTNKDTGDVKTGGKYRPTPNSGDKTYTKSEKGVNSFNKLFDDFEKKEVSIRNRDNIYSGVTDNTQKALDAQNIHKGKAMFRFYTEYPEAFAKRFPKMKIIGGVNNKTGERVKGFSDGTNTYAF